MPVSRHVLVARRLHTIALRAAVLCMIIGLVLYVARLPGATAFGVAGLIGLMIWVFSAGIATSEPET